MIVHAVRIIRIREPRPQGGQRQPGIGKRHSLCEQDGWGKVYSQPQHLRDPIVPVQILRVDAKEILARKWPSRGVEDVQ